MGLHALVTSTSESLIRHLDLATVEAAWRALRGCTRRHNEVQWASSQSSPIVAQRAQLMRRFRFLVLMLLAMLGLIAVPASPLGNSGQAIPSPSGSSAS